MKRSFCVALVLLILFTIPACQDTRKAKNYNDRTLVDDTGLALIKDGLESGMAEIALSKMAVKKSQNKNVVGFANMMITDHTEVGKDLNKIAADKKVSTTEMLNIEHKQLIDSLSKSYGVGFDKQYMQAMITDHQKAVKVFKEASKNTDRSINEFAGKTLPKLQAHLDEANKLYSTLR